MNCGSAFAAIVSPLIAGYVIDVTHDWYLPFLITVAVLLVGAACAFMMHPERPFEDAGAGEPIGGRRRPTSCRPRLRGGTPARNVARHDA